MKAAKPKVQKAALLGLAALGFVTGERLAAVLLAGGVVVHAVATTLSKGWRRDRTGG